MNWKPDEEWRPIPEYEGLYEASNLGRLRSCDRITRHVNRWGTINGQHRRGGILKTRVSNQGYERASLCKNGVGKTLSVHRLISKTFDKSFRSDLQVNHKDGNKLNNSISNLEPGTAKDNMAHAVKTGLYPFGDRNGSRTHVEKMPRGSENTQSKITEGDVIEIRRLRASGWTLAQIADRFPINFRSVHNIVRGKTWGHVL